MRKTFKLDTILTFFSPDNCFVRMIFVTIAQDKLSTGLRFILKIKTSCQDINFIILKPVSLLRIEFVIINNEEGLIKKENELKRLVVKGRR